MCFKIKLEAIKVIQRRRITEWPSFNYLYLSITNWDKTGQRVCSSPHTVVTDLRLHQGPGNVRCEASSKDIQAPTSNLDTFTNCRVIA